MAAPSIVLNQRMLQVTHLIQISIHDNAESVRVRFFAIY